LCHLFFLLATSLYCSSPFFATHREKLQKELFEQQERGELLKAKQKHFKENEAASKRQVKLWRDLQTLLEMKKVCLERQMQAKSARKELTKQDHLIL